MAFDWRIALGVRVSYGDGQIPDANYFRPNTCVWQGAPIHDNPRFFKYDWRIWTAETAIIREGESLKGIRAQRDAAPKYHFADAMQRVGALYRSSTPFIIASYARKRIAPETPWNAARIDLAQQACPYDADTDPEFHEHR